MGWKVLELPDFEVAPRAGAWIEILPVRKPLAKYPVAPRAGAWIEMLNIRATPEYPDVAPRAGAWIEISKWFYELLA